MTEDQKRLETMLLDYISKATEKPLTETDTSVIPQVAHELIKLWEITDLRG